MPTRTPLSLLLSLFVTTLLLNGCKGVELTNDAACSATSFLSNGMDCAESLTRKTTHLTLEQSIEFLEPQPERIDKKTGKKIPERGGAICQSVEDWNGRRTALDIACRKAKKRCTQEMRGAIEGLRIQAAHLESQLVTP